MAIFERRAGSADSFTVTTQNRTYEFAGEETVTVTDARDIAVMQAHPDVQVSDGGAPPVIDGVYLKDGVLVRSSDDEPIEVGGAAPTLAQYVMGVDAGFEFGPGWFPTGSGSFAGSGVQVFQVGREVRLAGLAIMRDTSNIFNVLDNGGIVSIPAAWAAGVVGSDQNSGAMALVHWHLRRAGAYVAEGVWKVVLFSDGSIWYGNEQPTTAIQALREAGDQLWVQFVYGSAFLLAEEPAA